MALLARNSVRRAERTPADESIDLLMITFNRPAYARRALERVVSTCDETVRVWLWHNGGDEETLDVVRQFLDHPRVYRFHHSPKNCGQREPTNWLLREARGLYLSKVDDDCLVPDNWLDVLRRAHRDVPEFGVLGGWRYRPEDLRPELAAAKVEGIGDHKILRSCWVEGTGFLMKRACLATLGQLPPRTSFTAYCTRLATAGWIHGWYYPFLYHEHMDDPRSPYWPLQGDSRAPGSPSHIGRASTPSQEERVRLIRARALYVQRASLDPRHHLGWHRRRSRYARRLIRSVLG